MSIDHRFSIPSKYLIITFSLLGLLSRQFLSCETGNCFSIYRAYTIQSNILVFLWLLLVILWKDHTTRSKFIKGKIHGAITLYITITWIVFMIALEPIYNPTGFELFPTIVNHYITPISFILDWYLFDDGIEYQWNWIIQWLSYPIFYLIFSQIMGRISGTYLYFFLNLPELGWFTFLLSVMSLLLFFILVGSFYILLVRYRYKKTGKVSNPI